MTAHLLCLVLSFLLLASMVWGGHEQIQCERARHLLAEVSEVSAEREAAVWRLREEVEAQERLIAEVISRQAELVGALRASAVPPNLKADLESRGLMGVT